MLGGTRDKTLLLQSDAPLYSSQQSKSQVSISRVSGSSSDNTFCSEMTGHWYWGRFGMVSETGMTFLIVLYVCFSLYCMQFLRLYFWDVQKRQEGGQLPLSSRHTPHSHWQVHSENCITKKLCCSHAQDAALWSLSLLSALQALGKVLCTRACQDWKRQGELAVKDKQCHTCVRHSQSGMCGVKSLSGSGAAAERLRTLSIYYCGVYQHSMLRLLHIY